MPRYDKGLFLFNGNAGKEEIEPQLNQTLPVISQSVKELNVIQTESIDELNRVCKEYGPKVDLLVILGGDGTVHECINSLAELDQRPVIGILPGGTCNDFSRMLEIPQNLNQAAHALVQGEEQMVDAGQTEREYFLNFWGIGLVTQTSFNIDENQKERFGVLSYFISALKTMNQASPFEFTIKVDDETIEGEAVMILVMNGRFIGTRPLPVAAIDANDGKFDVLVVKNSNLTLFKELLTMSQPGADDRRFQELHHHQGSKISIEVDSLQEVDMDGEIKGSTPAHIEVLPNHFTFLNGKTKRFDPSHQG
ncbi:YegS/Rv2252/BmrU family lipid kinase [Halobacillus locisalis]|uniref:YegS/Rv2252/BmrU family lipid kinase n=1 Tax=Halobacillus locisalis TaxID=220753 RepID=A0A838CZF0_9BACI|nr:YegS/Rv2252/BmrU family lipid kinase [Halobacillus locisalis]MBA2176776.1 YegS/Rv2252/BmrU family lipid kinase [Halobacillus locisalis]